MIDNKLVYNLSAALRILRAKLGDVVRVEKLRTFNGAIHAVYVIKFAGYSQRWSIFLSPKLFKANFAQFRQEQGRQLHTNRITTNLYTVQSTTRNYQVTVNTSQVTCECEDYKAQIKELGRGCCKHGYAVLAQLGFSSLRDYLNA